MTGPVRGSSPQSTRAALDEMGHLLLAGEDLQSVSQRVVNLVKRVMPPGAEASLTVLRDEGASTVACTGELARQLDEAQYGQGYGPCLEAAAGLEVLEIVDAATETRWPDCLPVFLARGARSAIAVPVPAAGLTASLTVYAPTAGAFTATDRRVLAAFAGHAVVALSNLDALQDARELAGNVRAAMESRSVIEQAKGILMERYKLTADQAFRLLADASMRTDRRLRAVADDLVATGGLTPPGGGDRNPAAQRRARRPRGGEHR